MAMELKMVSSFTYALLVPCYNATAYIDKFVHNIGLLNQQFDEIIFYDDGSTDDTAEKLARKGFTVIKNIVNNGPGFARNRLAEKSTCDFIHFHDIDDEFNPNFLLLIKDSLLSNLTDVIIGNADWLDADTKLPIIKWRYNKKQLLENPISYLIANPLGVINAVYTKTIFLKVGGFNERIKCWEDSDLHVRLAAANARFAVINSLLAYSIRHNNGISQDQAFCWECRLAFLQTYLDKFFNFVDPDIFKIELKKIQTMFIILERYDRLIEIIAINRRYNLGLDISKTFLISWAYRFLPSAAITQLIKFMRYLSEFKYGY